MGNPCRGIVWLMTLQLASVQPFGRGGKEKGVCVAEGATGAMVGEGRAPMMVEEGVTVAVMEEICVGRGVVEGVEEATWIGAEDGVGVVVSEGGREEGTGV